MLLPLYYEDISLEELESKYPDMRNNYIEYQYKKQFFEKTFKECVNKFYEKEDDRWTFTTSRILDMIHMCYEDSTFISAEDIMYIFSLIYVNNGFYHMERHNDFVLSDGMIERYVNFRLNGIPTPTISLEISEHEVPLLSKKGKTMMHFLFQSYEHRDFLEDDLKDHIGDYYHYYNEKGNISSIKFYVTKSYVYHKNGSIYIRML